MTHLMDEVRRRRFQTVLEGRESQIRDLNLTDQQAEHAQQRLRRMLGKRHPLADPASLDASVAGTMEMRRGLQELDREARAAGWVPPAPTPPTAPPIAPPPVVPPPVAAPPSDPPISRLDPRTVSAGSWETAAAQRVAKSTARSAEEAGLDAAFGRMSPYSKGVFAVEDLMDRAWTPASKAARGVLAGAAVYAVGGPTALGVGAGLWGLHKGLKWHRGFYAQRMADNAFNHAVNAGMYGRAGGAVGAPGFASDVARDVYSNAWRSHPASWPRNIAVGGAKGALKMAGRGIFAAGRLALSPTTLGAAAAGTAVAGKMALDTLRTAEYGLRALLTGGPIRGVPASAGDAYFPFRRLPWSDPRKIALNPRIVRRLGVGIGLAAAGAMVKGIISPQLPEAQTYFDGQYMHHMNDMGANSMYAQTVLGHNAAPGLGGYNPNTIRTGALLADDAALMAARMIVGR